MKYILYLIAISFSGCATRAEKATAYCDQNWVGRYSSFESCYDRKIKEQSVAGAFAKGFANGYNGN